MSLLRKPTAARLIWNARRAGRFSLVNARKATGTGALPGVIIVGAQRGGTTSMSSALRQHPAVHGAAMGVEVHYFDLGYHHGMSWYQGHFPRSCQSRAGGRSAYGAPIAFEQSPYYMFHPLAPARIARDLPRVKLLVLLRDPVERAYSAHAHMRAIGWEAETFERALELEDSRLAGETDRIIADPSYVSFAHRHFSYRTRGRYAEQLEQLEVLFGRDRIHVVDSEAFFASPEPVFAGVLKFLDLPESDGIAFEQHNARPRTGLAPQTRAALEEHYRPFDDRLARWLGHQPSWRQSGQVRAAS